MDIITTRMLRSAHIAHNDIVPYNFSFALQPFGMFKAAAKAPFFKASTCEEVEEVFTYTKLSKPNMPFIIEVMMDADDAPWRMLEAIALRGAETAKEVVEGGFKLIAPTTK